MNITVPVSVGEVIDKVTILEIKSERINDEAKLKNVATELEALRPLVSGGVFDSDELVELTDGLRRVNAELWDIEDDIRAEEAAGRFGDRFIELARAVYITNDRRAELKTYFDRYGSVYKMCFGPKSFMVVNDPVIPNPEPSP